MKLGLALGWHCLAFEELLDVVRSAEALGYDAVYVDGDVSQIPSRGEGDVLEGWTVTTALLAQTERIAIGSIRLVHHWNAARLAQSAATLERIAPGRLRFLVSIGSQPADRRFGFAFPPARERLLWLDETLSAVRALWRGETVSVSGRYVTLEGARVRPVPSGAGIPVEIAGRSPGLLALVARHAARWDVNLPPLEEWVRPAAEALGAACRAEGRDPRSIERSMWVFTRPGRDPADPALHQEFRRLNPWFQELSEAEVQEAIVAGAAETCRRRLAEIAAQLELTLCVVDLSGLDYDATRQAMAALAPADLSSR